MWFLIVALLASNAVACGKGCFEYEGNCACDQAPEKMKPQDEIQPSDEKPPRDKMPSYQREGIHADMPPISKEDENKIKASLEGKKAAGIR